MSYIGPNSAEPLKFPCLKVARDRMDAGLPDFQTFRRPFFHQKLPFLSGTLTFEPSKSFLGFKTQCSFSKFHVMYRLPYFYLRIPKIY